MKTKHPYIVKTPGTCFGKPRIDGHRIKVQDIVFWTESLKMSPDEIANDYKLTLAEIYSALAYYFDHIKEINKDIENNDKFNKEIEKKFGKEPCFGDGRKLFNNKKKKVG